ncbi:MAG: CoA pyrophosphatase [Proteobacteria bacterium]|nr:CoA pyrophosphatase [Pseudomonadota bacterium]
MDQNLLDKLIDNLPDCPNILARERYFNSAVLVPLIVKDGEYHLLFQKRADSIRQGSEICFPGGKHDPGVDKNCRETAVRETMEELGLSQAKISVLGRFDTLVAAIGATVDAFLGRLEISGLHELSINHQEVEHVFTLPLSFFLNAHVETYTVRLVVEPSYTDKHGKEVILLPAKELGLPENYHKPWGKSLHRVLVYKTDFGVIWGITAEIIHDMVIKIGGVDA